MKLQILVLGCLLLAAAASRGSDAAVELRSSSLTAGTNTRLQLTITSLADIPTGAEFIVTSHWLDNQPFFAGDDSHLIRVSSSAPGVRFSTTTRTASGVYGRSLPDQSFSNNLVIRVDEGRLVTGDVIDVYFRDFRLPTTALAEYRLPVFLRVQPDTEASELSGNTITLSPGRLSTLTATAATIVAPGEDISLALRQEDQYGNLVDGGSLSLDLLVNGRFLRRVDASGAVSNFPGIQFDVPGAYTLELRTGGGGLRASTGPVWVQEAPGHRIHWLGLGEHTLASDGWRSWQEVIEAGAGLFDQVIPADLAGTSGDREPESLPVDPRVTGTPGESRVPILPGEDNRDSRKIGNMSNIAIHTGKTFGTYGELRFDSGEVLGIALPEMPTDVRSLTPTSLHAAALVTGHSYHPWLLNRLGRHGYSPAVVALNHSHQYPAPGPQAFTGLLVRPDETPAEALQAGRSFVATGSRVVLHVHADRSVPLTPQRRFTVEVLGASPVVRVDMYRNGELVRREQGEKLITDNNVLNLDMEFLSDSRPAGGLHSRPRNGREWIGYVAARDATLAVVNRQTVSSQRWRLRESQDRRRIDFLGYTHGLPESWQLQIVEPTADTVLELGLAPGFEDAAWLPADRLPAELPGQRFLVSMADLETGTERGFEIAGYRDSIRISPTRQPIQTPVTIEFVDPRPGALGDFYYFSTQLADGSTAWSSVYMIDHLPVNPAPAETDEQARLEPVIDATSGAVEQEVEPLIQ